ncbi:ABC transporter permease [Agrobacterium vitis]|uniref:ABC transporter permease n=1 Tax=Agrobacterium vitis TaxID=373 RepID=UPI0012E70C17|nr:ABC transporter permease [Agrobacterium vitis]MVA52623.1 ABC transporter permease [Agrobacterium vitis]MVA63953.1 ABC transporter permease [Agrobacterium vitis]
MIPKQNSETEPRHTLGKTNIWKTHVATAVVSREYRATWLPVVALFVLIAYFALQQPAFLSPLNLTVMGAQAGPLLLISLGATFIVLMGSIDLSVAAVAALASAISAVLLQKLGTSYATAFLAVLGFGIAAGLLNSVLSTVLRLPSFIATLASGSIFTGIMLHVLDGTALFVNDDDFSMLANGQIIQRVPNVLLLSLLLWVVLSLATSHTRFGRYIVAIGAGERIAKLSGIAINRYKTYAFVLSSTLAATGGFFLLSRLGSATPSIGDGYLLDTVAAIVVGGTALTGGVGGAQRTLLGVALITILSNGLNVSGVSTFTQEIVKGVVIVIAVLTTIDRVSLQDIVK